MKLKTKFQDEDFDLGEVVEGVIVECLGKHEEELRVIATAAKGGQHTFYYSSIKKFMDDWEDAPEESVKPYWFVNDLDGEPMKCDLKNCGKSNFIEWGRHRKEIGNYFETEEEAEKAVEKLKAWKRLKDNGFEFDGIRLEGSNCLIKTKLKDNTGVTFNHAQQFYEDVDLLFGGE